MTTTTSEKVEKRPRRVRLQGRVLYLTENQDTLKAQLSGDKALKYDAKEKLIDNISTDEMTPGWVCFWYDETLGHYAFVGLRGGNVEKDAIWKKGFQAIASGKSKGCGSSRETAPYAEKAAGVEIVFAQNIEKIYGQNCQNIGLLTSTDFLLLQRLEAGEEVDVDEFTRGLDPVSKAIVEYGGLFQYNRARLAGETVPALPTHASKSTTPPMTLVEKIIARAAIADAVSAKLGISAVKPGDALFCRSHLRFSHDYTTAMAEAQFMQGFGAQARVKDPASIFAFRDHLTFLNQVMPEAQKKQGLNVLADNLKTVQEDFCKRQGIRLYDEVEAGGSEAICHNAVLEDLAMPGDLVVGTDSHTCTAGALGTFAFGVGSTEMANAWFTKDVRVTVPKSVLYRLHGKLKKDVVAKDVMLHVMAHEYIKNGKAIGQVLEFRGEAITAMSIDERATLTNMAVEAGATTGIIAADDVTVDYLKRMRPGVDEQQIRAGFMASDAGAEYAETFDIDLSALEPMVATPGDPRNGIPVSQLPAAVAVNIAYGGSCTGGKMEDMDMYASVLGRALDRGMRLHDGVQLYIQFGSQKIRRYAEQKGYLALFERAGVHVINPSCGACIKAGPGVSSDKSQVTISAINRNFPGRSGPGSVYLASPLVVAASAIAGRIVAPEQLFD
ncbi:MAG: 3-isopropylmalate dehydratase [Deltaproteobacteria bacterium]|nr:3-isopropylmalate dehydratase [Deltaproteobacteria bacterium]